MICARHARPALKAIQARGGRVIVLDPRRTETADRADKHVFIRPGTDAFLLLAIINELFAQGLVKLGRLARYAVGEPELRMAAHAWTAERAASITGIAADEIRALAREFAETPRAVLYGRVGVCTQEFGGLATCCYAVNALAGHLDEPGGLMFTTPALDPVPLAGTLGFDGGFARWTSRVSHKPEFGGELPMSVLAEEIETAGKGQIRALITSAGNPVLSSPGGPRLERAIRSLDFMVSIDPYMNETTRLAHVILPPASLLERSHYDAALNAFAVRNVAKYSPPVFERRDDQRHDWEILAALWSKLRIRGPLAKLAERVIGAMGPEAILDAGLRLGPHGIGRGGLSLAKLRANPHGVDLKAARAAAAEAARLARSQGRARAVDLCRRHSAARAAARAGRARHHRPPPAALEQFVAAQQRASGQRPAALHAAHPSRRCRGARDRRRRPRSCRDGARLDRAAGRDHRFDDARRGQRAARLGPHAPRLAIEHRVERRGCEHQRRARSRDRRRAVRNCGADRAAGRG